MVQSSLFSRHDKQVAVEKKKTITIPPLDQLLYFIYHFIMFMNDFLSNNN